jgi:hypothetical protein
MNAKTIVAIAAILVVLGAGYVFARPESGFWNGMMGYGNGYGNGMMGYGTGYGGGMMGSGNGAGYCGTGYDAGYGANATSITIEQAKESAGQYLAATGNNDLRIAEVMEFGNNFYAGVREKSTGKYAFELLVNKYTGAVFPEMGPNMMWNAKYEHMGWNAPSQATVTKEQAIGIAQKYLDRALPGTKTGDADEFYGYYTIEVTKEDRKSTRLNSSHNSESRMPSSA